MSRETYTVNSQPACESFLRFVYALQAKHKYLTFSWRIGEQRSLDQNSLLHVWLTEYAAHLLGKGKKQVSKGEAEGMKRHAKRTCYLETGQKWLGHEVVNPANPEQRKLDFTSSKDWKQGEMYFFLTWLQSVAAGDGLILESRGEYAALQQKEAA